MALVGHGAFGMNSEFVDEEAEFAWMTRLNRYQMTKEINQ